MAYALCLYALCSMTAPAWKAPKVDFERAKSKTFFWLRIRSFLKKIRKNDLSFACSFYFKRALVTNRGWLDVALLLVSRPNAALFCLYWHSLHYALQQRALAFMLICVMGLIFLTLAWVSTLAYSADFRFSIEFREPLACVLCASCVCFVLFNLLKWNYGILYLTSY